MQSFTFTVPYCTLTLCFSRTSDRLKCILSGGDLLSIVLSLLCVFWTEEWSLFLCGSSGCPGQGGCLGPQTLCLVAVPLAGLAIVLSLLSFVLLPSPPLSPLPMSSFFSAGVEKEALSIPHNGRTALLFIYPFLCLFIYSPGYFWSAVNCAQKKWFNNNGLIIT